MRESEGEKEKEREGEREGRGRGHSEYKVTYSFQHSLMEPRHLFSSCSEGAGGGRGQSLPDVHPESKHEDVREQQGGDEDFEELGGENPAFLHHSRLPHAERHGASGVSEVELFGGNVFRPTGPVHHPVRPFHQNILIPLFLHALLL